MSKSKNFLDPLGFSYFFLLVLIMALFSSQNILQNFQILHHIESCGTCMEH